MGSIFNVINKICKDKRVKHSEFRVFMVLVSYNTFRNIFPSLETISKDSGIKSKPDISKMLHKLKKLEYIDIKPRKNQSNKYLILNADKEPIRNEKKEEKAEPKVTKIPDNLDNPEFLLVWEKWKKYLKGIKKAITPITEEEQLKFLAEQPQPIQVIENSIRNGWQGIFENKTIKPNGKHSRRNQQQEFNARDENLF